VHCAQPVLSSVHRAQPVLSCAAVLLSASVVMCTAHSLSSVLCTVHSLSSRYDTDIFKIEFFGQNTANAGNYFEGTKCYKEIIKGCKEVPEHDGKQRTASAVLAVHWNTQQRNKCFQFSALLAMDIGDCAVIICSPPHDVYLR